jgi:Phosphotransferase enzyme family
VPNTDTADRWPELTEAAHRSGVTWAEQLAVAAPAVSRVAELAQSAGYRPDQEVMTHGDIDQKNLIATTAGPVLCDWDLAAPLVPRRELADVVMSLASWQEYSIGREVIRSYRQAGGDDTGIKPADLGPPLMTGLDWIAVRTPSRAVIFWPGTNGRCARPSRDSTARSTGPGGWRALCHHARRAPPRQSAARAGRAVPGRLGHDRAGPA